MAKAKTEFRMTRIKVQGAGHFPIDMLRYDSCVPCRQDDIERMGDYETLFNRTIELCRFSMDGSKGRAERWASFGWKVIEDTGI